MLFELTTGDVTNRTNRSKHAISVQHKQQRNQNKQSKYNSISTLWSPSILNLHYEIAINTYQTSYVIKKDQSQMQCSHGQNLWKIQYIFLTGNQKLNQAIHRFFHEEF